MADGGSRCLSALQLPGRPGRRWRCNARSLARLVRNFPAGPINSRTLATTSTRVLRASFGAISDASPQINDPPRRSHSPRTTSATSGGFPVVRHRLRSCRDRVLQLPTRVLVDISRLPDSCGDAARDESEVLACSTYRVNHLSIGMTSCRHRSACRTARFLVRRPMGGRKLRFGLDN